MDIDHSAAERVKQLEAEVLVYRDAYRISMTDCLMWIAGWLVLLTRYGLQRAL